MPEHLASGEDTGYGPGWDLESVSLAGQPSRQAGHDGEFFIGGSTVFIPFPERGLVLAVMTNTSFGDMWALALEIARACADPGRSPAPTQAAAARR